jgi:hypothetical protein
MMATTRMVTGMLLAATLAGWATTALAEVQGGAKAAFDRAMAAVAESSMGSDTEARAMGQAIAAVRRLVAPPAIPDAGIRHVGRAKAVAQVAKTPGEFLGAAKEYGEAARLAPWVAECQFNRGVLLQKAEHYKEAALALDLYLEAAPDAKDRTEVRALIEALRRIKDKSAQGDLNPTPRQAGSAPRAESHRAGETFRDCTDCPEMVTILAGRFAMGSPENEHGRFDAEGPQHSVSVRSFALGKYDIMI